ncbi:preprotein translocase subunit SecE [Weissella fangxianensis]|uniref:preprotein translocase subunit SecE n=1 Tax=Weissella fangxianensis TaxID=2953879 RepID=UPI00215751F7|nr:preprotein translocase subunit SecE [Weissella fangxianensis]
MKFISSVIKEMHTVTWPTFNENIHNTTIVVFTGLAFALIFGGADWVFEQGITWLSK